MLPAPSRNVDEFFPPYTCAIYDSYGESLVLSESERTGDIEAITTNGYDDEGELASITVTGNFYGDNAQSAIQALARFSTMRFISDQEDRRLLMILGFPQFEIRGRVTNFSGPDRNPAAPMILPYKFDFIKDPRPWQPKVFQPPSQVLAAEGKPYVLFTIPTTELTDLKALAYFWYGTNFSDGRRIKNIIDLNNLTLASSRSLSVGDVLKMPIVPCKYT